MHVPDVTLRVNKPDWLQGWQYGKGQFYLGQPQAPQARVIRDQRACNNQLLVGRWPLSASGIGLLAAVDNFHVQHLPHPHSGISASSIVMSDQWHCEGTRRRDGTSIDTKICKPAKLYMCQQNQTNTGLFGEQPILLFHYWVLRWFYNGSVSDKFHLKRKNSTFHCFVAP